MPFHLLERRRHRLLNTLHTWLLAAASLALLAMTAYILAGPVGVLFSIGFGTVTIAIVGRVSPRMVLSMYKAEPVPRHVFPEGHRLVEELARRAGLEKVPKLHLVPSRVMNAFAVGGRDDSAIAVTDGLVRSLSFREFAGVLAHEMSHIAHEDLRVMAFADMVSRYTSFMSTVGIFSLLANLLFAAGGMGPQIPWLAVFVLVLSPTVGSLLQLALSRTREFDADLGAAILTGDPEGLASALVKLEKAQQRHWEAMVLPGSRLPDPSILRTHPPTTERVARLMALKERPSEPVHPVAGVARASRSAIGGSVPRVAGRAAAEIERLRAMMGGEAVRPLDPAGGDRPCQVDGLREAGDRPRIRIRRGGVWW